MAGMRPSQTTGPGPLPPWSQSTEEKSEDRPAPSKNLNDSQGRKKSNETTNPFESLWIDYNSCPPIPGEGIPIGGSIAFKEMEMVGGAPSFSDWKEAQVLSWDSEEGLARVRYEGWCAPEPAMDPEEAEEWGVKMSFGSDMHYDPEVGKEVVIDALLDARQVKR